MDLRQLKTWGNTHPSERGESAIPNSERCLTLLLEGAVLNVPEIDAETYKEFRTNVNRLALQIPDPVSEDEKVLLVRTIVHEFQNYRAGSEHALREQVSSWRALVSRILKELYLSRHIEEASPNAALLVEKIGSVASAEDIQSYRALFDAFLRPSQRNEPAVAALMSAADRSTANDNAAGLRGAGSAVERLRTILERGGKGYVVLFRLSCLDVISSRFGPEALQDCLMAVSAFFTVGLHSDDSIYHWSDNALLAILQGRANEQILTAELQRLVNQNRDTTVNIGGRTIMVRIPIAFDLTPIEKLETAEDLFKLSWLSPAKR